MQDTFVPTKSFLRSKWYIIDVKDKTLGRVCTEIANLLLGKNKPYYIPYLNIGDHVIVVNAKNIKVTGNKSKEKFYYRHSGRPGSIKIESFRQLQNRVPERIIEKAIKGMLPKGPLGREVFKKLHVYSESIHPHCSQKPEEIKF
jgi:large subunit ribosomal protein L13|uniref:ribosomal protein L13 n=1 Tax=Fibrocapsa japonica TaxID=94617 RepID=UPI0021140E5D|nr:ribosomal protein L13 [Fibrocapsa japonica]UTE95137.1 ribosomal protein L13 [Fibrocapsa japonica]